MLIDKLISDIRIEIADRDEVIWQEDELVRAIEKCVSLMSRFIPKKAVLETTVTRTIKGETLTVTNNEGILAHKPIQIGSVFIEGRTGYTVNHLTGRVTGLPNGNYTVNYKLDPYMFDLSTVLPDYIKIERIEYPAGSTPLSLVTFDVFGNILVLRSAQASFTDSTYLRIIYLSKWTLPTPTTPGDYPSHLNDVVVIGSAGQALIYKAEEYTHKAMTSLDTASTALANLDTITFPTAPDIGTELSSIKNYINSISAVTFPSSPNIETELGEIGDLIDNIADITFPSAPTITAKITDAETALNSAKTQLQNSATSLGSMSTPLSSANTALGTIDDKIALGEAFLDTGEELINRVTVGERAGQVFGEYATHMANLVRGFAESGDGFIKLALAYEAKAGRETVIANSYIQEAVQRLAIVARLLENYAADASVSAQKVNYYLAQLNKAEQKLALIDRRLKTYETEASVSNQKVNYFVAQLNKAAQLLALIDRTLQTYETEANVCTQKVNYYNAQINRCIQLINLSEHYLNTSGRYLASGQAKINEFLSALGVKPEFHGQMASSEQRA